MKNKEILDVIYEAIEQVNQDLPEKGRLEKSEDTVIYGKGSELDSLELVGLLVAAEEKIDAKFKVALTLGSERAFSQKDSPLKTVRSLAAYIRVLLDEKKKAK
jgi:acyl carrier protein